MPNTRRGHNKRGEWAEFFIHYMKNSGYGGHFFTFITYGCVELFSEINKMASSYIRHLIEVWFYMNGPSKLSAAISSKQFFGLKLHF